MNLNPVANVPHTNVPASPAETAPIRYVCKPRTLADHTNNRKGLAQSKNEAARTLGAALEKAHDQIAKKEITHNDRQEQCVAIREAAEALTENFGEKDDDALKKFDLHKQTGLTLSDVEFLVIMEDVLFQYRQSEAGNAPPERNGARAQLEVLIAALQRPMFNANPNQIAQIAGHNGSAEALRALIENLNGRE